MSYLVVFGRTNIDYSQLHLFFLVYSDVLKLSFYFSHYINTFCIPKNFNNNCINTKYIGFLNTQPAHRVQKVILYSKTLSSAGYKDF